jgi:hypothetical protein
MAQQSAVEWFSIKTWKLKIHLENKEITVGEYANTYFELYQQAKEMEKHQHGQTWDAAIKAHDNRGHVHARSIVDFDEYYNETFNKTQAQ